MELTIAALPLSCGTNYIEKSSGKQQKADQIITENPRQKEGGDGDRSPQNLRSKNGDFERATMLADGLLLAQDPQLAEA